MKDIAVALNITTDAVSKALRDSPRISKATKDAVLKKANELGYVKNNIAVSLKSGNSNFVAVFINSFLNPYFAVVTTRIFQLLKENGLVGILCFCDKHLLTKEYIDQVFLNNCEAVISLVEPNEEVINILKENDLPIYILGIRSLNQYVNYIVSDDFKGGELVGNYFLNSKYKKACYISDSLSGTSDIRKQGFLSSLKNLDDSRYCILQSSPELDLSSQIINLVKKDHVDFIFCFSDYLATKVRRWLITYDNKIFDSVMVVGYDNICKWMDSYELIPSIGYDINEFCSIPINEIQESILDKNIKKKRIEIVLPVKLYNN